MNRYPKHKSGDRVDNEARTSFQLVCSRGGKESFGLSVSAFNPKHALVVAKRLMEGSGYSVYYPLTPTKTNR